VLAPDALDGAVFSALRHDVVLVAARAVLWAGWLHATAASAAPGSLIGAGVAAWTFGEI
jgi:hypothetical protein